MELSLVKPEEGTSVPPAVRFSAWAELMQDQGTVGQVNDAKIEGVWSAGDAVTRK